MIPDKVLEEIGVPHSHILYVDQVEHFTDFDYIEKKLKEYNSGELVILQMNQEICRDENYYLKLIEICTTSTPDVRLMMSTIDEFECGTHPYSNIYQWREETIRDGIEWSGDDARIQHRILQFDNSSLKVDTKKHRGILSVRKVSHEREVIFNSPPIVEQISDGITRYAKWPEYQQGEGTAIGFPNIIELKKEYRESYFAFVVETDTHETYHSQLSEKTLLPFMSGCLPIVYGNYEYVKKLQNLGFYIFNDTFQSWNDSVDFIKRAESFKQIISEINKLSMNEVKQFWLDNQSKIIHNYELLKKITNLDTTRLI